MFVKLVHSWNAWYPIDVTPSGIVTLVRPVHPWNAKSPIDVTPSTNFTVVRVVFGPEEYDTDFPYQASVAADELSASLLVTTIGVSPNEEAVYLPWASGSAVVTISYG